MEIRKSSEWINKTLNFQVHYCFDLPNLYCGFVHKRIIDKAYKDGKYFRSITPDAYSAFATAIFVDNYAFSHRPFSIAGASIKSNGASSMHPAGSDDEASKFYSENDIVFSEDFVNCPSFEVLVGEAFAKLAETFPDLCEPYQINYELMLNNAIANSNIKTEKAIRNAVAIMAVNFELKIKDMPLHKSRGRGISLIKLYRALVSLLSSPRVVAISQSAAVGVKDIDDAALAAHILRYDLKRRIFITTRDLLKQQLKL